MSMWQAIGEDADSHPGGKKNFRSKPQPIVFLAGLDFSHTRCSYPLIGPHHRHHIIGILIINTTAINARWGVIFGGPIVLGSLAVSVGLRLVSTDGDQDPHTREVVKKVGWRFFAFSIM